MKGPGAKVESILAVLFVIAKCVLHGGKKMDCLYFGERSFNAPVLSEIGKYLYADHHMPTPAVARPIHLLAPDAILL
jgi:hypothetical protein